MDSRHLTFRFFFLFPDGIYRIVYEEVDESDVKIFCFPSSNANFGEVEEFR
jgi:dipeptidyl-peptidase 9